MIRNPPAVALCAAFFLLSAPSLGASLTTAGWARAENKALILDDAFKDGWLTQSGGLARDIVRRAKIVSSARERRDGRRAERGSDYVVDIADLTPVPAVGHDFLLDDRPAADGGAVAPDPRNQDPVPTIPEPIAALAFGLGALILAAWRMRSAGRKRA